MQFSNRKPMLWSYCQHIQLRWNRRWKAKSSYSLTDIFTLLKLTKITQYKQILCIRVIKINPQIIDENEERTVKACNEKIYLCFYGFGFFVLIRFFQQFQLPIIYFSNVRYNQSTTISKFSLTNGDLKYKRYLKFFWSKARKEKIMTSYNGLWPTS